jgi:exodeoxyribonuclease III
VPITASLGHQQHAPPQVQTLTPTILDTSEDRQVHPDTPIVNLPVPIRSPPSLPAIAPPVQTLSESTLAETVNTLLRIVTTQQELLAANRQPPPPVPALDQIATTMQEGSREAKIKDARDFYPKLRNHDALSILNFVDNIERLKKTFVDDRKIFKSNDELAKDLFQLPATFEKVALSIQDRISSTDFETYDTAIASLRSLVPPLNAHDLVTLMTSLTWDITKIPIVTMSRVFQTLIYYIKLSGYDSERFEKNHGDLVTKLTESARNIPDSTKLYQLADKYKNNLPGFLIAFQAKYPKANRTSLTAHHLIKPIASAAVYTDLTRVLSLPPTSKLPQKDRPVDKVFHLDVFTSDSPELHPVPLDEDDHIDSPQPDDDASTMVNIPSRPNFRGPQPNDTCNNCGKTGHWSRECPEPVKQRPSSAMHNASPGPRRDSTITPVIDYNQLAKALQTNMDSTRDTRLADQLEKLTTLLGQFQLPSGTSSPGNYIPCLINESANMSDFDTTTLCTLFSQDPVDEASYLPHISVTSFFPQQFVDLFLDISSMNFGLFLNEVSFVNKVSLSKLWVSTPLCLEEFLHCHRTDLDPWVIIIPTNQLHLIRLFGDYLITRPIALQASLPSWTPCPNTQYLVCTLYFDPLLRSSRRRDYWFQPSDLRIKKAIAPLLTDPTTSVYTFILKNLWGNRIECYSFDNKLSLPDLESLIPKQLLNSLKELLAPQSDLEILPTLDFSTYPNSNTIRSIREYSTDNKNLPKDFISFPMTSDILYITNELLNTESSAILITPYNEEAEWFQTLVDISIEKPLPIYSSPTSQWKRLSSACLIAWRISGDSNLRDGFRSRTHYNQSYDTYDFQLTSCLIPDESTNEIRFKHETIKYKILTATERQYNITKPRQKVLTPVPPLKDRLISYIKKKKELGLPTEVEEEELQQLQNQDIGDNQSQTFSHNETTTTSVPPRPNPPKQNNTKSSFVKDAFPEKDDSTVAEIDGFVHTELIPNILLDSGSSQNVVTVKFLTQLAQKGLKIPVYRYPTPRSTTGVGGQVAILGWCSLYVAVGSRRHCQKMTFTVLETCPRPIIFGIPFLRRFRCNMNFDMSLLTYYFECKGRMLHKTVRFRTCSKPSTYNIPVYSTTNVTIPPSDPRNRATIRNISNTTKLVKPNHKLSKRKRGLMPPRLQASTETQVIFTMNITPTESPFIPNAHELIAYQKKFLADDSSAVLPSFFDPRLVGNSFCITPSGLFDNDYDSFLQTTVEVEAKTSSIPDDLPESVLVHKPNYDQSIAVSPTLFTKKQIRKSFRLPVINRSSQPVHIPKGKLLGYITNDLEQDPIVEIPEALHNDPTALSMIAFELHVHKKTTTTPVNNETFLMHMKSVHKDLTHQEIKTSLKEAKIYYDVNGKTIPIAIKQDPLHELPFMNKDPIPYARVNIEQYMNLLPFYTIEDNEVEHSYFNDREEPLSRDTTKEDYLDYLPPSSNATFEDILKSMDLTHVKNDPILGPYVYNRLLELLTKYSDIFRHGKRTGSKLLTPHKIILKDNIHPPCQPPYPKGRHRSSLIAEQVTKMLENNVIQKSVSPFAAPVSVVPKKDGGIRFVTDFRKLNEITIKDKYPLPRIDDMFDRLTGYTIFSTFDLLSGFWQIPVASEDRHKTAFVTGGGLYEYKVLPFGLTNSPPTFQRAMDLVLAGLKWVHCMVYIDDIIIFSNSPEEHLNHLELVFERLYDYNLKLKPSKCHFFHTELPFLGHIIANNTLRPDPKKLVEFDAWPTPTTITQVQRFLGFCNYFRKFVPHFSTIAFSLYQLTKPNVPFFWSNECEIAFRKLIDILKSPGFLTLPSPEDKLIIECDASKIGLGAALMVDHPDGRKPVAFASRLLSPTESNYSNTDREGLAVVWACDVFRHQLNDSLTTVEIESDHSALLSLFKKGDLKGRFARYIYALQDLDIRLVHKPGKNQVIPDTLSRIRLGHRSHLPLPEELGHPFNPTGGYPEEDRELVDQMKFCTFCKKRLEEGTLDIDQDNESNTINGNETQEETHLCYDFDTKMTYVHATYAHISEEDNEQTFYMIPNVPDKLIQHQRLKIMSWNVNGLIATSKKLKDKYKTETAIEALEKFLNESDCAFVCLQETRIGLKPSRQKFLDSCKSLQNWNFYICDTREGYNGVATFVRKDIEVEPLYDFSLNSSDTEPEEGRMLTLKIHDFALVNAYIPNGMRSKTRERYKTDYHEKFTKYIAQLKDKHRVIICSDMNVAPEEIDVREPDLYVNTSTFLEHERQWFKNLLQLGFHDGFRTTHPETPGYSWKGYNQKLPLWRVDHILVDNHLTQEEFHVDIDWSLQVSDHARKVLTIINADDKEAYEGLNEDEVTLYIESFANKVKKIHHLQSRKKPTNHGIEPKSTEKQYNNAAWPVFGNERCDIREKQLADPLFGPIITFLEKGTLPENADEASTIRNMSMQTVLEDGLLYKISPVVEHAIRRSPIRAALCIPDGMRRRVLELLHDDLFAAHQSKFKTQGTLLERFWWPSVITDLSNHLQSCETCNKSKETLKRSGYVTPIPYGDKVWERIHIDILGPLQQSEKGNKYVIVLTDHVSKWVEAFAVPDITAETVARKIVEEVFCRFGIPVYLHSDQGEPFVGKLMARNCRILGIRKTFTSPYWPRANGLVERFNKTLCNMIRCFVDKYKHNDWDELLPYLLFAYRTRQHSTTKETPFFLFLGRDARLPADLFYGVAPEDPIDGKSIIEILESPTDKVDFNDQNQTQDNSALADPADIDNLEIILEDEPDSEINVNIAKDGRISKGTFFRIRHNSLKPLPTIPEEPENEQLDITKIHKNEQPLMEESKQNECFAARDWINDVIHRNTPRLETYKVGLWRCDKFSFCVDTKLRKRLYEHKMDPSIITTTVVLKELMEKADLDVLIVLTTHKTFEKDKNPPEKIYSQSQNQFKVDSQNKKHCYYLYCKDHYYPTGITEKTFISQNLHRPYNYGLFLDDLTVKLCKDGLFIPIIDLRKMRLIEDFLTIGTSLWTNQNAPRFIEIPRSPVSTIEPSNSSITDSIATTLTKNDCHPCTIYLEETDDQSIITSENFLFLNDSMSYPEQLLKGLRIALEAAKENVDKDQAAKINRSLSRDTPFNEFEVGQLVWLAIPLKGTARTEKLPEKLIHRWAGPIRIHEKKGDRYILHERFPGGDIVVRTANAHRMRPYIERIPVDSAETAAKLAEAKGDDLSGEIKVWKKNRFLRKRPKGLQRQASGKNPELSKRYDDEWIPEDLTNPEYVIEKILKVKIVTINHKKRVSHKNCEYQYLTKWEGWSHKFNTWQNEKDLHIDLIKEFWATKAKTDKALYKERKAWEKANPDFEKRDTFKELD